MAQSPLLRPGAGPAPLDRLRIGWALVFLAANYVQYDAHRRLARLRRCPDAQPAAPDRTTGAYFVPHGGLFDYVSCPHYLAETVIYLALLGITSPPLAGPVLGATVFVVANQALAAHLVHGWYHAHFPDYPRSRRRLIPYVW